MRSSVISLEGMVTLKQHALQWRRFLGRNQIVFGSGRSFWEILLTWRLATQRLVLYRSAAESRSLKKKSHSVPHKNSLKPSSRIKTQKHIGFVWTPPSICNQTYPSTWCTLHKFHAQTIFFATIQSPGNDFGLWSAQLALPWWCPDPCCGMWRSLSATVDPQRSEIQDGRVVPRALWLGSSVVYVILVTYGFLMAFTI